jgi:O-methyltransferase
MHPPRSIYADPPAQLPDISTLKLSYYHVTDLPEGITTPGSWDLRGRVDDYLGRFDFAGKRVLEIGPASGFLTMEMEHRGADVVGVDIPEDGNWDFVPFPDDVMAGVREHRFSDMTYIRNTWWYTHRAFGLRAKAVYADAYRLPDELGEFDVAVLAAVLLHTRSPQTIVEQCAKRAKAVIITEVASPDLEATGTGVIRLHPTRENRDWGVWWHLSSAFFTQYLRVLGFERNTVTYHKQREVRQNIDASFFTVVAQR